jgi:hypothetical protein
MRIEVLENYKVSKRRFKTVLLCLIMKCSSVSVRSTCTPVARLVMYALQTVGTVCVLNNQYQTVKEKWFPSCVVVCVLCYKPLCTAERDTSD